MRPGVEVKLLAEDDDLYVFAQSRARIDKERAMRKRQLKQLWARLAKLAHMDLTRESLLMKLGAARAKAPAAWRLLDITVDPDTAAFTYALNRKKLRQARRREGRYLLRTNLRGRDPAELWRFYIQLVEVEAAFKNLKDDLQPTTDLSPAGAAHRGAHLRGLPRLLSARHAARPAQAAGSPASPRGRCSTS